MLLLEFVYNFYNLYYIIEIRDSQRKQNLYYQSSTRTFILILSRLHKNIYLLFSSSRLCKNKTYIMIMKTQFIKTEK